MPMAIGSQHRNISHQLLAPASQILRPRQPQLPPLVYCRQSSASEPVISPSQNMKENNHTRKKISQWMIAPTTASTAKTAPTMIERERIRSMTAGGAKSCGVMRVIVWLIALRLPQAGVLEA